MGSSKIDRSVRVCGLDRDNRLRDHDLREEAARCSRPATAVARQAIELWLRHRRKVARHEAIAAFAAEHAGTTLDLDTDLEAASMEHPIATHKAKH